MQVVDTALGRLRGHRSDDAVVFEGIPYGSAARFAAPGSPAGWSGVRDAAAPGPAAPQPRRTVALFTHGELPGADEQCLNLNVFTPDLEGHRPVLVWLHGGGFAVGHAGASLYSGEKLARAGDCVVVTVNYRLGSLGWLAHPALASAPEAPAANWGLLDQIEALRWVRGNIAAFGGDPDQVTLAGQSAGALCTMDLLVAPQASGLFRRAIIQSAPLADLAQPASLGARWAEALSAAAGGAGVFDVRRLRELDAGRIVALHEDLLEHPAFRGTRGGALPTVDGGSLPASPLGVPGASPDVDVLVGHTAHEGTFFFRSPWRPSPPADRIPGIVAHLCQTDDPHSVIDTYREQAIAAGTPHDPSSLLVDIATRVMVAEPLAAWAAARAAAVGARGSVYRYRVDHPGAGPELGATHTVDVPLIFGTWDDGGPGERLAGRVPGALGVSRALVTAWSAFMRDGSPGWAPERPGEPGRTVGVFGRRTAFAIESGDAALTG
jgi:para-nitrobenzyl esterase